MSLLSGAHNTAKADMTGASVYRLRHARRRTITTAVVGGAQMRPTFDHLTRDLDARLLWVVALLPFSAARISHGAAAVSYTHLRAHETPEHLVCRLLLEK